MNITVTVILYHFTLKKERMKCMKLPNSYGSVYKLSGKRRNPWVARKTIGYKMNEETKKAYPVYEFIGYYKARGEALTALADYNRDPKACVEVKESPTFEAVHDKWFESICENASKSSIGAYRAAYAVCDSIKNMKINEIKLEHLQKLIDESDKNIPILKKVKTLVSLVFEYAVRYEIIPPERREIVKYIDFSRKTNPNTVERIPFTDKEIEALFNDSDIHSTIVLMLIYSGCRIGELLDLKKEDVHLDERWFDIKKSKTKAGIRQVPIAEKIVPFFQYWLNRNCEYLICDEDDKRYMYHNFNYRYWNKKMKNHTPHDTRHTTISLLVQAEVDERIIKKIVGHAGTNVTDKVYTHLDLKTKLEAINKI